MDTMLDHERQMRFDGNRATTLPHESFWGRFRQRLHDRRFWIVQLLVVVATAVHWSFELFESMTGRDLVGVFIVFMYMVYFVPVIYASLNFGRAGAVPTAVWTALLAAPSIILWHHGLDRLAESVQHLTIIGLAIVIAGRVDREVAARRAAERESRARSVSEMKYRALFSTVGEAILVYDPEGVIHEANAAAGHLLGHPVETLRTRTLPEVLGAPVADQLQAAETSPGEEATRRDVHLERPDGAVVVVEPLISAVPGNGMASTFQVLFRDVTEQRRREQSLQQYTDRVLKAQEDERRRIARDLHDGAVQSVVLLYRELDVLETQARSSPPNIRTGLTHARVSAERLVDELRRFSRDLRPSILDDLGLVPAVRWLLTELEQRAGLQTTLRVMGTERRIPADVELGLFRIAQEAIRNVERHAHASRLVTTVRYSDDEIRLLIEDDGRGITSDDRVASSLTGTKLGLLGMQERARLLGGLLTITSVPEHAGTRVDVSIPLAH